MSVANELEKLGQLHASGVLTSEEFEAAKARVLGGAAPPYSAAPLEPRVFRRSSHDVWIGGVCGGLAEFTGIESWVWRLLFVIGLIVGGFSILPYVLLWVFVPRSY